MESVIVPLGDSCSVAHALQTIGIRKFALPFDWVRIANLSDITRIINNKFDQYIESCVKTVEVSSKFPIFDDDFNNSLIKNNCVMRNKYGVKFYHDDFAENCVDKYKRRINRFFEILNCTNRVIFIRDESKMKNISNEMINEFCDCIIKINPNLVFIIKVIIHNPKNKQIDIRTNERVVVINDTLPYGSWTRPNVDFESLLY